MPDEFRKILVKFNTTVYKGRITASMISTDNEQCMEWGVRLLTTRFLMFVQNVSEAIQ